MISCSINKWTNDDKIKHTSTVWVLARDPELKDVIDRQEYTDDKGKTTYRSSITVPVNSTYYIQAERKFAASPNANHKLPIRKVRNTETPINNLILPASIKIEQPFVYINETDFKDTDVPDFAVHTSEFRCTTGGHDSTHWIVMNASKEIIFKSLYDKFNKTSIRLDKSQDILNRTKVTIMAIHVSDNGVESEPGISYIANNQFSFDIEGERDNLLPYQDASLLISPASARNTIVSVYLNDQSNLTGQDAYNITPAKGSNNIVIPGDMLTYGSKYFLDIYCYSTSGEYLQRRYPVTVRVNDINNSLINHSYFKRIEDQDVIANLDFPNAYVTQEMVNGQILMPRAGVDKLYKYNLKTIATMTGSKLSLVLGDNNLGEGVSGVGLLSSSTDNMYIKFLNDNILLIDMYNQDTFPEFMVYTYDPVLNTYTLLQTCVRKEEKLPIGYNNNVFQVSEDVIWYLPPGSPTTPGIIYSYTISTNKVEKVVDLGSTLFNGGNFFKNRRLNKVFLYDVNGKGYILDQDTLKLSPSLDIAIEDWKVNPSLKNIELANGDYLFINIGNLTSETAIAYYDAKNNSFSTLKTTFPEKSSLSGVITTRYNDVLLISKVDSTKSYTIKRFY